MISAYEQDSSSDLTDLFQQAHVHGAPVVDQEGHLVGMVSIEDILIGSMTDRSGTGEQDGGYPLVRDIMTAPAISATEDTPVEDLCRIMWKFHIHHLPIVHEGKVTGIVSSLDICRILAEGEIGK